MMHKLDILRPLEDYLIHGDNDLRYEGGVAPTKHRARLTRADESEIHSARGVMDTPDTGQDPHEEAFLDECTPVGHKEPPQRHRFEYTDRWADLDKARVEAQIQELIAMGYTVIPPRI